jgi:hypothetical protein
VADEPSHEQITRAETLVVAAIAAAQPCGNDTAAWRNNVEAMLAEIHVALNPYGRLMRRALLFADAPKPFWGEYLGYELEQTSKRLVVSFQHAVDKEHPDGTETIRTDRTDTPAGERMHKRLDRVRPGTVLIVHKIMEPMRDQPGRAVRIMANFEYAPKSAQQNSGQTADPVSGRADQSAATRTGPPAGAVSYPKPAGGSPASPTPGLEESALLRQANDALAQFGPTHHREVVQKALRAGLWPPTEQTIEQLMTLINDDVEPPF